MKIPRKDITRFDNKVSNLIFISMCETFKDEALTKFAKDIDWDNKEEIEVKLTVEGRELDLRKYCERWQKSVQEAILKEASEIVSEKFRKISDCANEIEKSMQRIADEELGIKVDEDEY